MLSPDHLGEVTDPRTALAPIAAAFHGYPGAAMRVVGITGTDARPPRRF
jgi:UDP-N-acetylmuramyl tripeptide synthase